MKFQQPYTLVLLALALFLPVLGACQPVLIDETSSGESSLSADVAEESAAASEEFSLQFAFKAGEEELACGGEYVLGTADTPTVINDMRYYVSNIHLVDAADNAVPFELTQDGLWQYENVALLDFEDATAGCTEGGTAELNTAVVGTAPAGEYTGITFDLGVPFELNHLDVTTAPSPLNVSAMWWSWSGGYKFARIDMTNAETPWFIHLGSVGCDTSDRTVPPTEACAHPNVSTIQLADFDPASNVIVADLAMLLEDVDLSQAVPQPPGCMSGLDDPDCANLMPAFGLAWPSVEEAPAQNFFRVE